MEKPKESPQDYISHYKFPGVGVLRRFMNIDTSWQPPGLGTDADYRLTTPEAREEFNREAIENGKKIANAARNATF